MKDDNPPTNGGHSMKRLLIVVAAVVAVLAIAAVAAALALAGGGGSDNGAASGPSGNGAATVSVEDIGDSGAVLVDSAGKAIYESAEEADGSVICTDVCAEFWKPLTIAAGAPTGDVQGQLGVAERPDGARQVTLDGRPLYTFAQDSPGEVTGDGLSDAFGGQQFSWHVVTADGSSSNQGGSTSRSPYNY
jgi:predicted lipoprotein with Yx(FWY)xxD motif